MGVGRGREKGREGERGDTEKSDTLFGLIYT